MNLEVSLLPGRSLVVWARATGSTRPPLGGGRPGRDTTLNHILGIVELSTPGLARLLFGGLERLLSHLQGVADGTCGELCTSCTSPFRSGSQHGHKAVGKLGRLTHRNG